ncbi:MAG: hypothetical protein ACTSW1_15620 [Candidatus Hodarchaeales archaeon]
MKRKRLDKHRAIKNPLKCVICGKCGYKWDLDPTKWRNYNLSLQNGKYVKVVFCPACGKRKSIIVDNFFDYLEMIEHAHNIGESR